MKIQTFTKQNNKLLIFGALGILVFLILTSIVPFQDKFFSILFPKPISRAGLDTQAGSLKLTATFNSIGVELPFVGDDNTNSSAFLEFKKSTDTTWRKGLDLWRTDDITSPGKAFYGSALLLDPNITYDIKVTISDSDGIVGNNEATGQIKTREDNIPAASQLTPTYFVDGSVATSGNGSQASPWKTLQDAIVSAPSGAIVEVGPGFYKNPTSIRTNPITLKAKFPAVDDNRAVINEGLHSVIEPKTVADRGSGKWIQVSLVGPGNNGAPVGATYKVWKWVGSGVPYLEQLGIAPDRSSIPQRVARWETDTVNLDIPEEWVELLITNKTYNYGFWSPAGSSDIYIRIYDPSNQNHTDPSNTGLDPNNFWVTAGAILSQGIGLPASSRISGFEVRQFYDGISVGNGSVIDHNIISGNMFGIRLGSVNDVVIEKNLIVDSNLWTDNPSLKPIIPWRFIKTSIITANNLSYGDRIGESSETDVFYGRSNNIGGIVIRHNTVDGTFDGIVGNGDPGIGRDFDIHDNLIKHLSDDVFEPDGNSANWRVWNNRVENALVGVSPGPLNFGPFYLFRNQFYKVGTVTGVEGTPTGTMFKYSGDSNPTGRVFVLHNTIWTNIPGVQGGAQWAGGGPNTEHFYLRNNIFRVTEYAFSPPTGSAWNEDYNHFATTDTIRGLSYNGTRYTTNVSGYRTTSGQGTNTNTLGDFISVSTVDNNLTNPSSGDLALSLTSAFIDKGVQVPNISDSCGQSFSGLAPDLGAIEGNSSAACPSGSPTPLPTSGQATPTPTPTPTPSALQITLGPTVSVASSSATIAWTTNTNSSTKAFYGFSQSSFLQTPEVDLNPGVTSHTVTISNLVSCTKYGFMAFSRAATASVNQTGFFTTKGCLGESSIISEISQLITTLGGSLTLLDQNSKGIGISIPSQYYSADTYFQIKKLDKDVVIQYIPPPSGFQAAGSNIYRLDALLDPSTTLNSFNNTLTVTVNYSSEDVSGIDEGTLKIHRFNLQTNTWESLPNCIVDTAAKTVTCQTTKFSELGLFGTPSNEFDKWKMFIAGVLVGFLISSMIKKR